MAALGLCAYIKVHSIICIVQGARGSPQFQIMLMATGLARDSQKVTSMSQGLCDSCASRELAGCEKAIRLHESRYFHYQN
jgi:hypothetical protein